MKPLKEKLIKTLLNKRNLWNVYNRKLFLRDKRANLSGANLSSADLSFADLSCADLSCADLSGADLSFADLSGADLSCADLSCADMSGSNLHSANLSSADLSFADLSCANLSCANLHSADLSSADLSCANLHSANLSSADLHRANLSSADLHSANLSSADLHSANLYSANLSSADKIKIITRRTILPDGDLIVYKKLADKTICKLKIPADAKRVGGVIGRKCRAEYAIVIDGEGKSSHDNNMIYKDGEKIIPDEFDDNPFVECSNGIHFFITREEAEEY